MSRHAGRRQYLQRTGHPTSRLVRYADDLLLLVRGTRQQAATLLGQLAGRVQALGLSLKSEKTAVTVQEKGIVLFNPAAPASRATATGGRGSQTRGPRQPT